MKIFKTKREELTFGVKENQTPSQTPSLKKESVGKIQTPNVMKQTGIIKDIGRDAARSALLPGKRVSKTGKTYWETRRNRSDAFRSNL